MSTDANTVWLESAFENFEEALSEQNLTLARDIIADIKDKGFVAEAKELLLKLPQPENE